MFRFYLKLFLPGLLAFLANALFFYRITRFNLLEPGPWYEVLFPYAPLILFVISVFWAMIFPRFPGKAPGRLLRMGWGGIFGILFFATASSEVNDRIVLPLSILGSFLILLYYGIRLRRSQQDANRFWARFRYAFSLLGCMLWMGILTIATLDTFAWINLPNAFIPNTDAVYTGALIASGILGLAAIGYYVDAIQLRRANQNQQFEALIGNMGQHGQSPGTGA